nr:hypothetical protein [Tanacetum cinerariifolium]
PELMIVKQQHKLDEVSYHKLFDILKQYQKEVNELRAKRLARNANPLALTAFEEDIDPKQAQRDTDMQKNLALIANYFKKIYKPTNNNLKTSSNSRNKNVDTTLRYKNGDHSGQFRNQRTVNVAGARKNVRSPVVQQSGIQCFNCKEFGHFSKECRKPKRAEQYDWIADTDEEVDKQELEARYIYMAKIQEVPTIDTGTDYEPVEQVQNDNGYNVFANNLQHSKQSKSVSNTCLVEMDDSNVIPGLPDMCEDDIQNEQNDVESDDERVALANLIANLNSIKSLGESISVRDTCLVVLQNKQTEFEKYKAFNDHTIDYDKLEHEPESDKAEFLNMYDVILQECVSKDVMSSYLMSLSDLDALDELQCLYLHKVKECDCLAQKLSNQTESVSKEVHSELLKRFAKVENHLISLEIALQKHLKAQLQDKNIAISELKKLIEKGKGKSVDTEFDKPFVVRQPNAQRIQKPLVLGKPAPFSNSIERIYFSKTKSVPKANVSEGLSKPVTAQTLPQTARQVIVQLILFIVDSGYTKHITGNLKLLCNFVEKFLGTVHFGNDQFAPILGYGDLVQRNVTIIRVYYVKGLNHNLFLVGQFCDANLEVAFKKSTCFVKDLQGNDLLTAKRSSFKSKAVPSSKGKLNLLHIDLCGPMRVASLNGKKYILVIVHDYSRYTWTLFLRSKDETPEVLKEFLTMIQRNLQASVITNGIVKRRNRTLVEAARMMVSASKHPLFFWNEAIATACYTQNRSIIIPTHDKTSYHIINDRKPSIKHLHIFGCICYITIDGENLDKMKEKGDSCILVGYSTQSKGYRVYNKRTRLIVKSIHIRFDEIKKVFETFVANDTLGFVPQRKKASDYDNPGPVPQRQDVSSSADAHVPSQQELDLLFGPLYDKFFNASSNPQDKQPSMNIQSTSPPSTHTYVHAEENNNHQAKEGEHLQDDEFTNPFCAPPQEEAESSSHNNGNSNVPTFNQLQVLEYRWTKDHPLEQVRGNPSRLVQTRRQLATDLEMCMYALTVSTTEPKKIKEAMADFAWIEAMQEELHQFDRLQVRELVDKPFGKTVIRLK